MKRPAGDLAARRPVWQALSELFLDTDPEPTRAGRIRELAGSPYGSDELEAILLDEVFPVCRFNLWSVAGEWQAFDIGSLEREILRRAASPLRFLRRLDPGRRAQRLDPEWQATKAAVIAARR